MYILNYIYDIISIFILFPYFDILYLATIEGNNITEIK